VILREKDYDRWLQAGDPERFPIDLLRPYDADKMTIRKVDKAIGDVKNNRPELIEPASAPPEQADCPRRIALEGEFRRDLHESRRCRADDTAQVWIFDLPVYRCRPIKLGLIEDIESLRPDL
jgi:hypothetical protein